MALKLLQRYRRKCIFLITFSIFLYSIIQMYAFTEVVYSTYSPSTVIAKGVNGKNTGSALLVYSDIEEGIPQIALDELENGTIPKTVHYVWCKNSSIKFENYLSIMSVWKLLQPDSIEFYTKYDISKIDDKYNLWLQDLKQTISGLVVKMLPEHWDGEENGCGVWFPIAVLDDRGGIFVADDLIVTEKIRNIRRQEFLISLNDMGGISMLVSSPKNKHLRTLKNNLKLKEPLTHFPSSITCISISSFSNFTKQRFDCAHVPSALYPRDIMTLNNSLGRLSRLILYGERKVVVPRKYLPGTIPKIIHLVWFREKEMDFMMYLSLRSILVILNPDKVYIHGDKGLYGKYLDEFKNDSRIVWVLREAPSYIFGKRVLFTQHKSDIIRADVLLKYGGIYMDWDVLWLKPIDDLLNTGYDAIVNFDHMSSDGYPDAMNLGVFMAKPGSDFVRLWQQSLINYRSKDFYFNALQLPYKTFEKYPRTIHIEKTLQVMCFRLKCHPIFKKEYKNFMESQPFDWRKDAYAIHFTYPDPPEYANETVLMESSGMFAEIGQYIMKQPYIQKT